MINSVSFAGFKSFPNRVLNLNKLTLLTGLNCSGKSSLIQALLMISKAANGESSVLLDGHGSIEEIKNRHWKEDISLSATDDNGNFFSILLQSSETGKNYKITCENRLLFPEVIYISANRFGPRTSVPIHNDSFRRCKIGANGENLFQFIEYYEDYPLNSKVRHEKSEGDTLLFNIRAWLSVISPNIDFNYHLDKKSDSSYATYNDHRSANVGFGLSYTLPVITSLLVGTLIPNSLVIIENPEAHLHPKGQTEIARLISVCAQVGTQIIIETHSDHLFDGIRIEAKKAENFAKDVQIFWFELDENKNTEVYSPVLSNDGLISIWPKGFFDQFEINASQLI